jgi:hypothetical protein
MDAIPLNVLTPFHHRLNPRLWRDHHLRLGVRLKLFQTALAFYRFLALPNLKVNDIIMTGSNAAFNYTPLSDIDVHLVVQFSRTTCPALAENFFTTKKTLWNQTYHITVHGHPLELYVEDTTKPVQANGVYSILRDHWLKMPSDLPPRRNDTAVLHKVEAFKDEIDALLVDDPKIGPVNQILERLRILRQNGLLDGGEFSVENLTYKILRSLGYMQKLYDARIKARDKALSIR